MIKRMDFNWREEETLIVKNIRDKSYFKGFPVKEVFVFFVDNRIGTLMK